MSSPPLPCSAPERAQQRAARRQESRLQQVRHWRRGQLKARLKREKGVLQALRPGAACRHRAAACTAARLARLAGALCRLAKEVRPEEGTH